MTTTNINAVASFVVMTPDGNVDDESTEMAFHTAFLQYKAERLVELEAISAAVHAVFDTFVSTRMNMPSIWTYASRHLNSQPENDKILEKKTLDYIRQNAPDPNSKIGQAEAKKLGFLFHIGKGRGACVVRLSDWTEKEVPATK